MMKKLQALITGLFITLIIGAGATSAATWTVTKTPNSNDGACDADCSLREAVAAADTGDTIIFVTSSDSTFSLGDEEIVITKRIIIDGLPNNPKGIRLSGSVTSRIFLVESSAGLDLRNATLVQGNGASSNFASGEGGAIYVKDNAVLLLDRVAVRDNKAQFYGAIRLGSGTHRVINSSFDINSAATCTGIGVVSGNLYLSNVTVGENYDNFDGNGAGAICVNGSNAFIRNSTIAYNSVEGGGGGIFVSGGSTLNIGNTIVAQNTAWAAPDILSLGGTIMSVGGNLIGNLQGVPAGTFSQPNDISGVNPLLAPLYIYSDDSPVMTYPLQAGSPARNGGLNQNAVEPLSNQPLTTDARGAGFPRISDGAVDKGAYEDLSGDTSLIVTEIADSDDNVCDLSCSLREAVHQAGVHAGTDTITFFYSTFVTHSLTLGEITIQNQTVNIVGYPPGAGYPQNGPLRISGQLGNCRIFRLDNATVSISGLTLSRGRGIGAFGAFGGAILAENNSNLTLDRVIVRDSSAAAYGAIYLSGGTHRIVNSTIYNNSANTGLAIGVSGTLNMANTTVSGNFDADGGTGIGAIYVTGTANIRNSTIAFNRTSGGTGGGIFNAGILNIGNTIVSNNIALTSPDVHQSGGTITSAGGNLVQNTNGFPAGTFANTNDVLNTDPLLGVLGDNGGNMTTHSLLSNSPAINGGLNAAAVDPFDNSPLTTDARGAVFSRIQNSIVDKGAFELLTPTAASVSISGRVTDGKNAVARASVLLTSSNGETRTVKTNSFGYFQIDGVQAGATYIINVYSKGLIFTPQIIPVYENVSDLVFIPEE